MIDRLDQVLLYSGGLDSLIAWEYLGQPTCLRFKLGHRYDEAESHRNSAVTELIEDESFQLTHWEEKDANIPARNLLLAIGAARYADRIWLVVQEDEMSIPDRTESFMRSTSVLLSTLLNRDIRMGTPFPHMDKTDMVAWWLSEGLGPQRLLDSWSCYRPKWSTLECGDCPACIRKFISLHLNGVDCKGHFYSDPMVSETAGRYRKRAKAGDFSAKRMERTIDALGAIDE